MCPALRTTALLSGQVYRELWPERSFIVDPEGTILNGAQDCRFHIIEREEA